VEHVQKFKVESEEEKGKHLPAIFLLLACALFPMPEESFS